jgi:3-hydroxy-9,10-secoandrosta-1,3,5(10)-triene-9,17-dione monooxygenase
MIKKLFDLIDASSAVIDEAERKASFSPEFIHAIASTGFFDLTRPKRFGGHEIDYEELLSIILTISSRNGSLGWCLMILGQHNIVAQSYPESVANVLFKERPLLLTTCFTPVGHAISTSDNGYRLSGHWRYATGIQFCNWVSVDAKVDNDSMPSTFLVPAKFFNASNDWDTIGMRATGSFSVALNAEDSSLIMRIPPDLRGHLTEHSRDRLPEAYRIPQRVMTALGTLAPVVGMLNGLAGILHGGPRPSHPGMQGINLEKLAARQALLTAISEAAQCDVLFRSLASAVTRLTKRREAFSHTSVQDILHQCGLLAERCAIIASRLFVLSGTQSAHTEHPVSRILCDIHVMSSHYLLKLPVLSMNAALASMHNATEQGASS